MYFSRENLRASIRQPLLEAPATAPPGPRGLPGPARQSLSSSTSPSPSPPPSPPFSPASLRAALPSTAAAAASSASRGAASTPVSFSTPGARGRVDPPPAALAAYSYASRPAVPCVSGAELSPLPSPSASSVAPDDAGDADDWEPRRGGDRGDIGDRGGRGDGSERPATAAWLSTPTSPPEASPSTSASPSCLPSLTRSPARRGRSESVLEPVSGGSLMGEKKKTQRYLRRAAATAVGSPTRGGGACDLRTGSREPQTDRGRLDSPCTRGRSLPADSSHTRRAEACRTTSCASLSPAACASSGFGASESVARFSQNLPSELSSPVSPCCSPLEEALSLFFFSRPLGSLTLAAGLSHAELRTRRMEEEAEAAAARSAGERVRFRAAACDGAVTAARARGMRRAFRDESPPRAEASASCPATPLPPLALSPSAPLVASGAQGDLRRRRAKKWRQDRRSLIAKRVWSKTKFLRQFEDEKNEAKPDEERFYFPVHSICQAEGYNLRGLYEALVSRHCYARFPDDSGTALYIELPDYDLPLVEVKARSHDHFEPFLHLLPAGPWRASSFSSTASPLFSSRPQGRVGRRGASSSCSLGTWFDSMCLGDETPALSPPDASCAHASCTHAPCAPDARDAAPSADSGATCSGESGRARNGGSHAEERRGRALSSPRSLLSGEEDGRGTRRVARAQPAAPPVDGEEATCAGGGAARGRRGSPRRARLVSFRRSRSRSSVSSSASGGKLHAGRCEGREEEPEETDSQLDEAGEPSRPESRAGRGGRTWFPSDEDSCSRKTATGARRRRERLAASSGEAQATPSAASAARARRQGEGGYAALREESAAAYLPLGEADVPGDARVCCLRPLRRRDEEELDRDEAERKDERHGSCFVFANGAVVVWGGGDAGRTEIKREMLSNLLWFFGKFASGLLRVDMNQEDVMFYCYIDDLRGRCPSYQIPRSRVKQNRLYLKTRHVSEKLAASYAIAQSIRLDVYEALVNATISRVREVPERMSRYGCECVEDRHEASMFSLPFGSFFRKEKNEEEDEYSKQFADLSVKIIDVNIVEDFLDVPEFFWEDDKWQSFWQRVHNHLELQERIDVLNSRYSCILELLNVVRRERSQTHEFRMTWIVVVLLAAQVVAVALKFFVFNPR